jgi:2-polyprenyl-3-methyl-5-hydroxy-6-metoxy-1,4-benzoquinol methylase
MLTQTPKSTAGARSVMIIHTMSGNTRGSMDPHVPNAAGLNELPAALADIILLAWPPMLTMLARTHQTLWDQRVLDFGCGDGNFCRKLASLGAHPVGLNPSPAFLESERKAATPNLSIQVGGMDNLGQHERFDIITSVMALPFIQDLNPVLSAWAHHSKPNTPVVIAVFNPGFVRECLRAKTLFRDFDSIDRPRSGILDWTGHNPTQVYIRYAEEYAYAMEVHGFQLVFEARPPFTADFLRHYPQPFPTTTPEFLIMGFRRQT